MRAALRVSAGTGLAVCAPRVPLAARMSRAAVRGLTRRRFDSGCDAQGECHGEEHQADADADYVTKRTMVSAWGESRGGARHPGLFGSPHKRVERPDVHSTNGQFFVYFQ